MAKRPTTRSRGDLKDWASEHLLYEARMLQYSASKALEAESQKDRNAYVESFAIHVRCLREFLWFKDRDEKHKDDARAWDFCADGVWAKEKPGLPQAISAIEGDQNRIGREIVHLTYHRLDVEPDAKDWEIRKLLRAIASGLARFVEVAEPDALAIGTRQALGTICEEIQSEPSRKSLTGLDNSVTGATQSGTAGTANVS